MRPETMAGSRALAPVRPVSSSTVHRISSGPWTASGSSATAMAVATPMPLSAPRVVPSALTQSPSTRTSMGSFTKSKSTSEFFSQTMSRWPWRITVGADSWPGVAGTFTARLPVASLSDLEALLLRPALDVGGDLLLVLRRPGDLSDAVEVGPEEPRLQVLEGAAHDVGSLSALGSTPRVSPHGTRVAAIRRPATGRPRGQPCFYHEAGSPRAICSRGHDRHRRRRRDLRGLLPRGRGLQPLQEPRPQDERRLLPGRPPAPLVADRHLHRGRQHLHRAVRGHVRARRRATWGSRSAPGSSPGAVGHRRRRLPVPAAVPPRGHLHDAGVPRVPLQPGRPRRSCRS